MKIVNGILVWLLILGAFAAGVLLLYLAVLGQPATISHYLSSNAWRFAAGLLVVVLAALAAATMFPANRRDERFISFDGESGSISISVRAVTEFIVKTSREFAGVLGIKASITSQEEPIEVLLDLKLKAGVNVPELCRLLQEHVRSGMRETIGISEIGAVRVKVREIAAAASETHDSELISTEWPNG